MYWHVMFVAVVFIAVEYQQKLFYTFLMGLDYFDKREKIKLGICILSSREHFEEREALRNTWLQLLNSDKYNENSKAVFVIGESCPVSPDNRLDVYSCNKWDMSNLALEDINYLFYCQNQPDEKLYNPLTRISLQVLHSVKVRRIGIYEGLLNIPTLKPLTIILFNGLTEEEIASVKFSKEDKGFLEGGFYYQPIQVLTLPKSGLRYQGKYVATNKIQTVVSLVQRNNNMSESPDQDFTGFTAQDLSIAENILINNNQGDTTKFADLYCDKAKNSKPEVKSSQVNKHGRKRKSSEKITAPCKKQLNFARTDAKPTCTVNSAALNHGSEFADDFAHSAAVTNTNCNSGSLSKVLAHDL